MKSLGIIGIVVASLLFLGYIILGYMRYRNRLNYVEIHI